MGSLIKKYQVPELPGVYLMKKKNKVIYVGKAKNLKKRVSSYFNLTHKDQKTLELVGNIDDFEFILCKSELDALILENNLIKKYNPKYNILLKDQKTYPYIKISKEDYSRIEISRRVKNLNDKNYDYFGPYPSGSNFLLKNIIKIFKIRDCKKDMKKIYSKPCLKYHMNLCLGPCAYKDIKKEYGKNVDRAKDFLKGNGKIILENLKEEMILLGKEMNFEKAIKIRDQIQIIETLLKGQITEVLKDLDEDAFVLRKEGNIVFLTVLKVRDGKILGVKNLNTHLKLDIDDYSELLESIFMRYYINEKIPKNIILDPKFQDKGSLLEEYSKKEYNKSINLFFPKIESRRKKILEMAYLNLDKEVKKHYNQKEVLEEGMKILYDGLDLKKYPLKIECFDISNISGKDAVGAMSVAVEGRLSKKDYRKFKIKTKDTPDDYHMMREVIERRYSKLPENEFPDLILIDGGLGQLNTVDNILKKLKKEHLTDLISIAKREEEIFKAGEKIPYLFDKSMEALKILQRLRDEAHRFGITYHRSLRKKRIITTQLKEIKGIGDKKEKKLLERFKSVKRMKEASLTDLMEIVTEDIAEKIKRLK